MKGCGDGDRVAVLWEGSVPKLLDIDGPAEPDQVFEVDRLLRVMLPGLGTPTLRRVDVTADFFDPAGQLREAAIGWNPHARSRYVQGRYQDDETVWQHNKSRGVRVYDNFAEKLKDVKKRDLPPCRALWAAGMTRVEYQIGGDWVNRYGLDRLYRDFARNADRALQPVVSDLLARV